MKELPILFKPEMVRALLAGQKTQTRRVANPQPARTRWNPVGAAAWEDEHGRVLSCPYGQPGDRLWGRETCRAEELPSGLDGVRYLADNPFEPIENSPAAAFKWMHLNAYRGEAGAKVPSIHMPRWASRILLEVVSVRVERLQDISEADAEAEGIDFLRRVPAADETLTAKDLYECPWEYINGAGSWAANPWLWAVEFKVITQASKPEH